MDGHSVVGYMNVNANVKEQVLLHAAHAGKETKELLK